MSAHTLSSASFHLNTVVVVNDVFTLSLTTSSAFAHGRSDPMVKNIHHV